MLNAPWCRHTVQLLIYHLFILVSLLIWSYFTSTLKISRRFYYQRNHCIKNRKFTKFHQSDQYINFWKYCFFVGMYPLVSTNLKRKYIFILSNGTSHFKILVLFENMNTFGSYLKPCSKIIIRKMKLNDLLTSLSGHLTMIVVTIVVIFYLLYLWNEDNRSNFYHWFYKEYILGYRWLPKNLIRLWET